MKKLLLAVIALASAFAISSCCDQSYCPGNRNCNDKGRRSDDCNYNRQSGNSNPRSSDEPPYRFDTQEQSGQQERQHRRW